ncbi:glycosyl transferase family protein [Roseomonas hellenica]|uniref:Glycosyl transferase family protein n=1 Tax=Plastoroseomonas hellenica TaxID=2687306 RepID=A0ABS5F685_9PROT|nr:glycosyl transferase family protein [Plastoroseomonas hellenica]MBR0668049.1 glycosyl transferase family protein [Plastoroseomonas hellenica]
MPRDPHTAEAAEDGAAEHPFAPFVRTLGRGPGRSRALTWEEARTALRMVLRGEADPHQVGAFLMLLRYRGEDPDEVAGLVEAGREASGCGGEPRVAVDLDWPSYGAGRTRTAPWFLLAALALAQAGHRVLMHGSNAFSSGMPVPEALALLGLRPAEDRAAAARMLDAVGFAYLPLARLSPGLDRLLGLRTLLGLRSPINTVARLLNPCDAPAGVDGVFHPPYIALHLAVAARLGRQRLLVVKGGGGEAERTPLKPVAAHLLDCGSEPRELALPAILAGGARTAAAGDFLPVWRGEAEGAGLATVLATLALGLLALGEAATPAEADARALQLWRDRVVR